MSVIGFRSPFLISVFIPQKSEGDCETTYKLAFSQGEFLITIIIPHSFMAKNE